MINWVDLVNLFIVTIGLTVATMGMFLALRAHFMDEWVKKYFIIVFSITIAYALSDFTSQISLVFLSERFWILSKVSVFGESFFSSLLMPMLTIFMLNIIGEKHHTPFMYVVMTLWGIYFLLLTVTQFTSAIYYITEDNVYKRGPLYPVLLVPPFLLMAVNLFYLYKNKSRFAARDAFSLHLYIMIPMVAMAIQMFSYGILLVVLGTCIAVMIMFLYIMDVQVSENIKKSAEIVEQKLMIRTLQMRPHFIYNTLSNIYYLCDIDPEKAKAVIGDFSTYLQKNFTAITKQEPIAFSEELVHTKAYLSVVKARFEGLIFEEYDTDFSAFKVPPLTLEPIVENAVKHGLDPESSPLHIFIRTEHGEGCNRIIVENDGVSFSADSENGFKVDENRVDTVHIGLSNVRERLKNMCNGSLTIAEREGGGTVVTMIIPDK